MKLLILKVPEIMFSWPVIRLLGITLFFCTPGLGSQAQSSLEEKQAQYPTKTEAATTLPNKRMPVYQDTGNPELDAQNHKAALARWNEHKSEEQPVVSGQITIMLTAFNKLSPREQAVIKASPDLYKIVDLGNRPVGKGEVSKKALETMNPEKAAYIKQNPDLFEIKD